MIKLKVGCIDFCPTSSENWQIWLNNNELIGYQMFAKKKSAELSGKSFLQQEIASYFRTRFEMLSPDIYS